MALHDLGNERKMNYLILVYEIDNKYIFIRNYEFGPILEVF